MRQLEAQLQEAVRGMARKSAQLASVRQELAEARRQQVGTCRSHADMALVHERVLDVGWLGPRQRQARCQQVCGLVGPKPVATATRDPVPTHVVHKCPAVMLLLVSGVRHGQLCVPLHHPCRRTQLLPAHPHQVMLGG